MYRLGKRAISQYIRTGCRRRLRLDLYARDRDRREADAPIKDASRPGLALLTSQGRAYERAKFRELETIFPELVVRGALKDFDAAEDRAFQSIRLADHIDRLTENQFALEAEYEITDGFIRGHHLGDLRDGSAVADGQPLGFDGVRPDIIQLRPANGALRASPEILMSIILSPTLVSLAGMLSSRPSEVMMMRIKEPNGVRVTEFSSI
jgi:DNA replication ATP-dependent helicase/nuclease Dna2